MLPLNPVEANPWEFGWTEIFAILGLLLTAAIAIGTYQTFRRTRREKVEEKRIEVAIEALSLAHESRLIFEHIRGAMVFGYEWADMQITADNQRRQQVGPFYAILKRVEANKEFFDRAWRIQVRCTAVFGRGHDAMFRQMQQARRNIEVAAGTLLRDPEPPNDQNRNLWDQLRGDIWEAEARFRGDDRVGRMLDEFVDGVERLCRPVVEAEYKREWPSLLEAAISTTTKPFTWLRRKAFPASPERNS